MSTGTPATALSRRRDFAPCRTRVLTVRSRSATKHRQSEVPRLIALVTARCTPQPWRPPHRCRPAMSRTPLAAFRLCFDARRATDAGSFTVFRRAPPIVVGRPPCNALSQIVALRADRRRPPPRASRLWTLARRRSSPAARPLGTNRR